MKKYLFIVFVIIASVQMATAQNNDFIQKGHIVFERRSQVQKYVKEVVNLFPGMRNNSTEIIGMYDSKYKPFQVTTYDFYFTPNKSLYLPQEKQPETHQDITPNLNMPGQDNQVFSDYSSGKTLSSKSIIGSSTLNISDTIRPIKWRITGETREIAGYECRRANALINDSLYVVAFYTTQIAPSMGPESFHGLPGMILGLSLPYLHSTWFAPSVSSTVDESQISETKISKKNKLVTEKEFSNTMNLLINNIGSKEAGNYLIQYLNF